MNKTTNNSQHIFHMFPKSLTKFFFNTAIIDNGFISYNLKTQNFNKEKIWKREINSIDSKKNKIPSNINKFEKKLSLFETEYAPFLANLYNYSREWKEINVNNNWINGKVAIGINENRDKFEKKWRNYNKKGKMNICQFFYYLTIQLKYFNSYFINNEINEKEIEKLIFFLELNNRKNNLLTKKEKKWFDTIKKLENYIYGGNIVLKIKNEGIDNEFNFNNKTGNAFTSNVLSITKLDNDVISFVLPINFNETVVIFFFNSHIKTDKYYEYINSEIIRLNLLENPLNNKNKLMPWRFSNYGFWNNKTNVLFPNGDLKDTKLIYYPFEIASIIFGCEKLVLDINEKYNIDLQQTTAEIINNKILENESFKKDCINFHDAIQKRNQYQEGSIFIFYYMILKYEKGIESNDKNFIEERNKLIKRLRTNWSNE